MTKFDLDGKKVVLAVDQWEFIEDLADKYDMSRSQILQVMVQRFIDKNKTTQTL